MNRILMIVLAAFTLLSCGEPEDYVVVIKTEHGDMKAILFDETPQHKENFIKLAKNGSFNNTIFHRVIQGFMIQGGDVNAKSESEENIEYTIPAEINENPTGKFLHTKGALAAARQGDQINPTKASSGCQFYIVDGTTWTEEQLTVDQAQLNMGMRQLLQDSAYSYIYDTLVAMQNSGRASEINNYVLQFKELVAEKTGRSITLDISEERLTAYTSGDGSPHLDAEYTVFGRVVEGFEVIDKIAAVKTAPGDRPEADIPMTVELEGISKQEIKEKYNLEGIFKTHTTMKVLITGSNGLLGQKLINLLAPMKEVTLIATARGANRYPQGIHDFQYESMDITSPDEVNAVFDKVKPEYVINTAAMTNVDQCETEKEGCWKMNVDGVTHLISACKKHNTFLLHLSTDFIFDGEDGPYDEDAVAKPISYYGESKLAAEKLLIASDIKWSIARTVLVYGIAHDMSRSNIILWVKNSLEQGKEIKVVNDQWRTPTLAEDLAMGCYLIVKHSAEGIYNISGKNFLNPYQMAQKTADFFNLDTSTMKEVDGSIFSQPAKRPPKTGFILEKAVNDLGYDPVSFEEGIAILAAQVEEIEAKKKHSV